MPFKFSEFPTRSLSFSPLILFSIMNLPSLPIISILFFLLFLPYACSIYFQIPRFDPTATNIVYEGDAVPAVGMIELINNNNYVCRVGRATYAEKVPLWDSHTGKLSDFTTHFSFNIYTLSKPIYGHGIALFLAPVNSQIPPNSAGGFLGLFNTTTSDFAGNQIVAVEFDTYVNVEWDPPYQHVGINNNSIASVKNTFWNASLHDGVTTDVWIVYNATTTNLSVHWGYQTTPASTNENTSLSFQIDLMKILPEWVTIGFSAGTGEYGQISEIVSWEFNSTLDRKYTGSSTGIQFDNGKHANKTRRTTVIALVAVFGIPPIVLISATKILRLSSKRNKKEMVSASKSGPEGENFTSINEDSSERGTRSRRFLYSDVAIATNNFSDDKMLGEGGSGAVYRADFTDSDTAVAVKRISSRSGQGRREYMTEVNLISRHPNLVQLKGWCHDKDETMFLLVYEFMPNGSLDSHLFGKERALTWGERHKIYQGLATALLYLHDPYLHEGWKQCVVHRDIKSSNILLDSSFNVKLGDFGLARIMDHKLGPKITGLAGTHGYLDPEYVITRKASKESDVYSFGVVALEIATGKRSVEPMGKDSEMGLVEWVWDLYGQGKLLSAMDELLQNYDQKQAECLMIVGLWCAHPDRNKRPSIRQAIQFLNFDAELPNPPRKMPVRMYHEPTSPSSVSSFEPSITCLEEGTISYSHYD